jgi:uncharacterized protein (DUF362 family)
MLSHIRAPDLHILDSIWTSVNSVTGHPDTNPVRTNKILASVDPLALDYWASKNILFQLSQNPIHNPDEPLKFRMKTLLPAYQELQQCGGINGKSVTMNEQEMKIYRMTL